ncbi:hypothetical protein DVDV_3546 [Desulfovibrio sp. DV]|nr:hypothetical protein DVDV_3546 [Desulfovibrio sp. DV]
MVGGETALLGWCVRPDEPPAATALLPRAGRRDACRRTIGRIWKLKSSLRDAGKTAGIAAKRSDCSRVRPEPV